MKLKKADSADSEVSTIVTAPTSGAVIADRFKLDTGDVSNGPAGVNKTAAMIAMFCALAAVAMIGAIAALMYMNWDEIALI